MDTHGQKGSGPHERKLVISTPLAGMRTMNTNPIFPVPANQNTKSADENLKALEALCHVVEYKAPYALVHASPMSVARISAELALEVFHAKRGGEYYAVRVVAKTMSAPTGRLSLVPPPAVAPVQPAVPSGVDHLTIQGSKGSEEYVVRETKPKRSQDARRWEARKLGDEVSKPRIVTFQDTAGTQASCSCEDWIYRRHTRPNPDCKHCKAFKVAYGRRTAANVA
jgi:hypothetical protein